MSNHIWLLSPAPSAAASPVHVASHVATVPHQAIIGDEGRALALPERHFDHRVAAGDDIKAPLAIEFRATEIARQGEIGKGGGDVKNGDRTSGLGQRVVIGDHRGDQIVEQAKLDGQGLVLGRGDAGHQFAELDGGKAHHIGQGLAMNEGQRLVL